MAKIKLPYRYSPGFRHWPKHKPLTDQIEVDWNNPLTKDLIIAFPLVDQHVGYRSNTTTNGQDGPRDYVSGRLAVLAAETGNDGANDIGMTSLGHDTGEPLQIPDIGVKHNGRFFRSDAAGNTGDDRGFYLPYSPDFGRVYDTGAVSVIARHRYRINTHNSWGHVYGQRHASTGSLAWGIALSSNSNWYARTDATSSLLVQTQSGEHANWYTSHYRAIEGSSHYLAFYDHNHALYDEGSGSVGGSWNRSTNDFAVMHRRKSDATEHRSHDGQMDYVYVWARNVQQEEAQHIVRNPFEIFKPKAEVKYFLPSAAPAATTTKTLQLPKQYAPGFRTPRQLPLRAELEIDWSHPLAEKLHIAYVFNNRGLASHDLANGFQPSISGIGEGPNSAYFDRTSGIEFKAGDEAAGRSVSNNQTTPYSGFFLASFEGGTDTNEFVIAANMGSSTTSFSELQLSTSVPDDGLVHAYGFSVNAGANNKRAYFNGESSQGTVSSNWDHFQFRYDSNSNRIEFGTGTNAADTDVYIGSTPQKGGDRWQGGIQLALLWRDRWLTDAEQDSLAKNPYQILKPRVAPVLQFPGAGGGGAYSLTAEQGSFTLTGADADLLAGRSLTAEQGSFTLTGADADLLAGRSLTAEQGSFTLTGADASLLASRELTAEQGSFTLTGADADLTYVTSYSITAEQGTFTLTGADAGLSSGLSLTAEQGSFTLTGADASLLASRELTAEQGSFTLTGADADLSYVVGYSITAEQGTFTLTGADANLAASRALSAEQGSFTLTGGDADLDYGLGIDADQGSFTLTGGETTFRHHRIFPAEQGTFTLTGADADLSSGTRIAAELGAFTLTGADADFLIARRLVAEQGTCVLTGANAQFDYSGAILIGLKPNLTKSGVARGLSSSSVDRNLTQE